MVVQPTAHDRVDPSCEVRFGKVRALVQSPGPHPCAHHLQGFLADRRIETEEHLPGLRPRPTRPEREPQERERRVLVRAAPLPVPGLVRVQLQSGNLLISVVATVYLLGVSTRRVEKLADSLGVTQLSKSQVSAMAKHLDEQVTAFRNRPLDAGPYSFVWVDALTQKVREGGRIVNVHALIAVGVSADGHREILGLDVATAEDGAGWLAFLRSLIARGLSGVQLAISDAHADLVDAIGAVLPGASWQRCRTH